MMTLKKLFNLTKRDHASVSDIFPAIVGQAERNAERIEAIKREMGAKWILHPSHQAQKLDTPRPV